MFKEMFYSKIPRNQLDEILQSAPTPGYIYFKSLIQERIQELKSCVGERFHLHYAVKANPHPEILKIMAQNRIGVDVSSAGELKQARLVGIPAQQIEFTGPGKSESELTQAISTAVGSINIESLAELETIEKICRRSGLKANVGIRINPSVETTKIGLKMAGETQFGVPEKQLPEVMKIIQYNDDVIAFKGIHVHIGSQILDAEVILNNIQMVLKVALELEKKYKIRMEKINFGGGWGINYFSHQQPLNLADIRAALSSLLQTPRFAEMMTRVRLILEPGRFLVGESGIYVTRVLYRKPGESRNFLIVDGGLHQNYLIAGGMGQVIRRNFELDFFSRSEENTAESQFDIAGKLCTPQDMLATNVFSRGNIQSGDFIVFFNCGAYGYSASPLFFLTHPHPAEILI